MDEGFKMFVWRNGKWITIKGTFRLKSGDLVRQQGMRLIQEVKITRFSKRDGVFFSCRKFAQLLA